MRKEIIWKHDENCEDNGLEKMHRTDTKIHNQSISSSNKILIAIPLSQINSPLTCSYNKPNSTFSHMQQLNQIQ